jgi:hypothetical protein
MDNILLLFLFIFGGFAIYGIECLIERFHGYHFNSSTRETLDELWSDNKHKLFRSINNTSLNMEKMKCKMRPRIIDIALEAALKDIKDKGTNSKIYTLMEEHALQYSNDPAMREKKGVSPNMGIALSAVFIVVCIGMIAFTFFPVFNHLFSDSPKYSQSSIPNWLIRILGIMGVWFVIMFVSKNLTKKK